MICEFSFGYGGKRPEYTPENCAKLDPLVRGGCSYDAGRSNIGFSYRYTGDIRAVMQAFPEASLEIISGDLAATAWEKIQQDILEIKAAMSRQGPAEGFNDRCSVHVPGLGLLIMNELHVERDSCTDRIQERLDEGWRIVAVCPQPDQRRPDYILGRTNLSRKE